MKLKLAKSYRWIKDLNREGYTYIIMPKRYKKSFYATKAVKRKKNGEFYANDIFDRFELEDGEAWIPGKDTKNIYIRIS